jgi:hypothetical protein
MSFLAFSSSYFVLVDSHPPFFYLGILQSFAGSHKFRREKKKRQTTDPSRKEVEYRGLVFQFGRFCFPKKEKKI